jgi:hypothetical protein
MADVALADVAPVSVALADVAPTDVALADVALRDVALTDAALADVALAAVALAGGCGDSSTSDSATNTGSAAVPDDGTGEVAEAAVADIPPDQYASTSSGNTDDMGVAGARARDGRLYDAQNFLRSSTSLASFASSHAFCSAAAAFCSAAAAFFPFPLGRCIVASAAVSPAVGGRSIAVCSVSDPTRTVPGRFDALKRSHSNRCLFASLWVPITDAIAADIPAPDATTASSSDADAASDPTLTSASDADAASDPPPMETRSAAEVSGPSMEVDSS